MSKSSFNILESVRKAYVFLGLEWRYLLKMGVVPMVASLLTLLFIQFTITDANAIEIFLISFPANILFAWYTFIVVRLIVLNERVNPAAAQHIITFERQHAMKACVLILLLFNMFIAGTGAFMQWAVVSKKFEQNQMISLAVMFVMGLVMWGLRFGIVHILAAVNVPIKPFLERVQGLMFSMRLIGMGLMALIPIYIGLELVLRLFLPVLGTQENVRDFFAIVISRPISLVTVILLNASATFALKEMLGKKA